MEKNRRIIVLDGGAAGDRRELHRYLRERLELPETYGRNLDALYDLLTDICGETVIRLERPQLFADQLGWYGKRLLRVFEDAAEANESLTVEYGDPKTENAE